MPELHIQHFQCIRLEAGNENAELARVTNIPPRSARRMSILGKQLSSVLEGMPLDMQTTLIYATSYTEARALETYLDSFPYASPTAFQTSIHPGGIEQSMILKQQELGPFFPLAGGKDLLVRMFQMAFTSRTPRVALCGGEESASWLGAFGLSWPRSFAFSMLLSEDKSGALGTACWDKNPTSQTGGIPTVDEAMQRLEQSGYLEVEAGAIGRFTIRLA